MNKETTEDYLKAILELSVKNGKTRNTDVAKALGITRPSVTNALSKLETEGYFFRTEDKSIRLTEEGMALARITAEKHETFVKLLTFFGVEKAIAEDDACKLEHDVSEESYKAFVQIRLLLEDEQQS